MRRALCIGAALSATFLLLPLGHAHAAPSTVPPTSQVREATALPLAISQRTALEIAGPYTLGVGNPERGKERHSVMLREERAMELKPGKFTMEWTGLPDSALLETATLSLVGTSNPTGAKILGVRFVEPQMTQAALTAALRGMPATVTVDPPEDVMARMYGDGRQNPRMTRTVRGTFVSLEDGVVLQVGNAFTVLPPSKIETPVRVPARRLLVDVEVPQGTAPARTTFELTTLLENVTLHAPHYVLHVSETAHRASLEGSLLVSNASGYALEGARVFYTGGTATLPTGSYRRRADEPTGVASTWAAAPNASASQPFALSAPITAGASGIFDVPVVHAADLPFTPHTSVRISSLSALTDRQENPEIVAVTREFELDLSSRALGPFLPFGTTVVHDAPGQGPALPVGEGYLVHQEANVARVSAQVATWGLRVIATQLSTRRVSKCVALTSYRYALPRRALESSPLEIVVPYGKKSVTITVPKESAKEGVSVRSSTDETAVVVARRKATSEGEFSFRVDYKSTECP